MKAILYTAVDDNGEECTGYVDARNNRDALDELSSRGFSEISFYDDAAFAVSRDDLDGLSEREREAVSRFETRLRSSPRFSTFILEVVRIHKYLVIGGLCLFL